MVPCATAHAGVGIGVGIGVPLYRGGWHHGCYGCGYRPFYPSVGLFVAPAPVYVAAPPVVYVQRT